MKFLIWIFVIALSFLRCSNDGIEAKNGFFLDDVFYETQYASIENQGPYQSFNKFKVTLTLADRAFRLGEDTEKVNFISIQFLSNELGQLPEGEYDLVNNEFSNQIVVATNYEKNGSFEDIGFVDFSLVRGKVIVQKSEITIIEYELELSSGSIVSGFFLGDPISTYTDGQIAIHETFPVKNYNLSHGFIQKSKSNGRAIIILTLSNVALAPGSSLVNFGQVNYVTIEMESVNGELSNQITRFERGFFALRGLLNITDNLEFVNSEFNGIILSGDIQITDLDGKYSIQFSGVKSLSLSNEPSIIGASFIGEIPVY